jgi:nucleoside-diphosphate-sugar epimerase
MKVKTVVVTGANGYIGRHVVKSLLDMGYQVKAIDLVTDGVDPRAEISQMSVFGGDPDIYQKLGEPDVVIHMAWRNGFVHNADTHILDIPGHYTFIKNLFEGGLKQIAIMGTMHEVGYWEGAIDENTPTNPRSLYGMSKNILRQIALQIAGEHGGVCQWLRAYYIIGDDLKNHSVFTKISEMAEAGKPTFPFTSGKNQYDFLDVEELARQIAAAATQDEITGIINCCSGKPVSLADKVEEFIAEHGYKIRPDFGAYPDRPYDSPGIWGDAARIRQIMSRIL